MGRMWTTSIKRIWSTWRSIGRRCLEVLGRKASQAWAKVSELHLPMAWINSWDKQGVNLLEEKIIFIEAWLASKTRIREPMMREGSQRRRWQASTVAPLGQTIMPSLQSQVMACNSLWIVTSLGTLIKVDRMNLWRHLFLMLRERCRASQMCPEAPQTRLSWVSTPRIVIQCKAIQVDKTMETSRVGECLPRAQLGPDKLRPTLCGPLRR